MSAIQLIDVMAISLGVLWLTSAVLKGSSYTHHPILWFSLGTLIFLQVGALRDYFEGTLYSTDLEWKFRAVELAHYIAVWAGFGLGMMIQQRGGSTIGNVAMSPARFFLAALVANILKLVFLNPFAPFDPDTSAYSRLLGEGALPVAALTVALYHQRWSQLRGARKAVGVVILAMLFVLSSFGPSRTPVMYALFVLMMYAMWRIHLTRASAMARRVAVLFLLPAGLAALLAAGSLLKGYSGTLESAADPESAMAIAKEHGSGLRFIDAYENGMFVLEFYPNRFHFRIGESIGALLLGVVPRSVWPEKPIGFSGHMTLAKLGHTEADAGTSLATSLVGDMWGGGGWANVLLLSVLFGVFLGWAYRWHKGHSSRISVKVIYWLILFMAFLSARGDIYTVFQRGGVYIVFTALLVLVTAEVRSNLNFPAALSR